MRMVLQCDNAVAYFIEQLKKHGLYEKTNIVFTADHGHV